MTLPENQISTSSTRSLLLKVLYVMFSLVLFFFALGLMTSSLQRLGSDFANAAIAATSNPFTALFIGLIITAMLQSSSATTAMTVALVASGSITLHAAVPIIMGANVGTTITSTLVSVTFIDRKKEFKRAVAAGTYHCFFNLLTLLLIFPLEYYYGFLSTLSSSVSGYLSSDSGAVLNDRPAFSGWLVFNDLHEFLFRLIKNQIAMAVLSFLLLFFSILLFRRIISDLLRAKSPESFSKFFFENQWKSFFWGVVTTAAIRSSTITTSVVVPIVAKKVTSLREAAPFIMGANLGTTITAFIAVIFNTGNEDALSIGIAHVIFNLIGVIIFLPVEVLGKIPLKLANALGSLCMRHPFAFIAFIVLTFFLIPFLLIYFNPG